MLVVYVWNYRGKNDAWGHASMQVGSTYISWWPEHPGQVPSGLHKNIYSSYPIRNRTFGADVEAEKSAPDHIISINGLNERAVLDWWQSFGLARGNVEYQGPLLPWSTLDGNCSTIIAKALRVGGGDNFASWSRSWNLVWGPIDVLQYARSIKHGLAERSK